MMVKIVTLFLIVMVVLAMFGAFRLKRGVRRCPACGRSRIGPGPCGCGKGRR
ncbi:hypothetical protein [Frigidibacter sp.]|uniref:hypothetical protein n=1 Tax=Frigidibacter sp. TaxID=2586418 RepID=UPI0027324DE0|nr:hypothetical protein [Frigidibacter sp.]MDP3341285.1 hypothetical protein [Frigidibacter sp.]